MWQEIINNYFKSFILLSVLLAVSSVNAASISYQIRDINAGVNNADYRASWASQSSAISTQELNDFNFKFGGNNSFSRLAVSFATGNNTQLAFQLAVDAGYGGALYLDNNLLTKNATDLWWNYNWNNGSEILSGLASNLSLGNHVLEVFWAEGCCNGSNSARFSVNGSDWQDLNMANLDRLNPVPVPAAFWFFGSGLIGLLGVNRKRILG